MNATDADTTPALGPIRAIVTSGACATSASATPQLETMESEQTTDQDLEQLAARVADLEAKREQIFEPTIDELQQSVDRLESENERLEDEVRSLTARLDSLGEIGADKRSTPKARMLDLRALLLNKARADYEGAGDGKISWTYSQVIDALESNGHGSIYAPQAYTAMEDAADAEGFGEGTNSDDERVIRVNWTAVPAYATVNEINNGEGVSPDASPVTDG